MELKINAERWNNRDMESVTGIYIRAMTPGGKWDNADLAQLDRESIIEWTKSRENGALNTLLILLGYDQVVS